MNKILKLFFILLIITPVLSCKQKKQFTFLSHKKTGITFRNTIKESKEFNILEYSYLYNGAGVAIGDINNDGLPDIYFTGNLVKSRLYLNKGNFKFEDISKKAGVSASETWNNGATMVDVNGDGWLDIYVCSSTDGRPEFRKNILFINNGDLTFTDKAREYGIDDSAYSTHSTFFDYDKDGDLDLFVLNHSVDRFAMFTEESAQLKKQGSEKYGQKFFINNGDRFIEATKEAGFLSNVLNFGLGVAVADFNNDNWPDIYVCNDFYEQDYLYINQQDGTFSEKLEEYCRYISLSSMGCDAGDINNDGFIDLITLDMLPATNYGQKIVAGPDNYEKITKLDKTGFYHQTTRNMLQLNNNGENFTEIGQYAGIYKTNWSWSALFCDYDNDGLKDLFISNGYGKNNTHMDIITLAVNETLKERMGEQHINRMEFIDKIPPTIINNFMFRNNGDLTFQNVSDDWGFNKKTLSNGAAYADLDNDGDMDIVINNINEYAFIYRNNADRMSNNHYLRIKLKGSGMNTGGIGARVDVTCGDNTYTQEFYPSRGYMSSMGHTLVFGLGKASSIDKLTILWPDLKEQTINNIKTGQTITLDNKNAIFKGQKTKQPYQVIFEPVKEKLPLQFKHIENEFIDFKEQPLLPFLLSTQGPFITKGDVNNDGMEDLFIGGAKDSPGSLYLQNKNSTFELQEMECFQNDKESEDTGVLFVDVDGDSDLDLYVVSGGNEFPLTSGKLQDRLYLNDGEGFFSKSQKHIPKMITSGSCVKSADIDNDGDADLFIGGRLTPGLYPIAPRSYILENNGNGYFSDVTKDKNIGLLNPGMVTDAIWTDFNGDNLADLILVGEWMPVRLFLNTGSAMEEITGQKWMEDSKGWWNSICSGDFDKDGDTDYVFGNVGLNFQVKPTPDKPATIYANDFDSNGILDPVMCYYMDGKNYPIYSKYDLGEQIPEVNNKYPTYKSFAGQAIQDIFPKKKLDNAFVLEVNNFSSCYLKNLKNNQFELSELPLPAQLSPVFAMKSEDYNNDGNLDLLLAGNFYGSRIKFGHLDANRGLLLLGDGAGNFEELPNIKSGLNINGEVRDIARINLASGNKILIFTLNNDSLLFYQY